MAVARKLHLRYAGTDSSLVVDLTDVARATDAFTRAHRARFGFATPDRPIVVEAVAVEGTAPGEAIAEARIARRTGGGAPEPVDTVAMWSGGATHATPVFERTALRAGDRVAGRRWCARRTRPRWSSPAGRPR